MTTKMGRPLVNISASMRITGLALRGISILQAAAVSSKNSETCPAEPGCKPISAKVSTSAQDGGESGHPSPASW